MSKFDPEKLKALQNTKVAKVGGVRVGGAAASKANATEDRKVTAAVTKLNGRPLPNVFECNMFHKDGTVTHMNKPKVILAHASNTFAVSGKSEKKQMVELMPGILNQIGLDGLNALKDMLPQAGAMPGAEAEEEAPELVDA